MNTYSFCTYIPTILAETHKEVLCVYISVYVIVYFVLYIRYVHMHSVCVCLHVCTGVRTGAHVGIMCVKPEADKTAHAVTNLPKWHSRPQPTV